MCASNSGHQLLRLYSVPATDEWRYRLLGVTAYPGYDRVAPCKKIPSNRRTWSVLYSGRRVFCAKPFRLQFELWCTPGRWQRPNWNCSQSLNLGISSGQYSCLHSWCIISTFIRIYLFSTIDRYIYIYIDIFFFLLFCAFSPPYSLFHHVHKETAIRNDACNLTPTPYQTLSSPGHKCSFLCYTRHLLVYLANVRLTVCPLYTSRTHPSLAFFITRNANLSRKLLHSVRNLTP